MTRDELASFDGEQGRKAYVAVSGKVYDVTMSPHWQEGNHQDVHRAGADLTVELQRAPHVRSLIERFPVVAVLEEDRPGLKSGGGGSRKSGIVLLFLLAGLLGWFLLR